MHTEGRESRGRGRSNRGALVNGTEFYHWIRKKQCHFRHPPARPVNCMELLRNRGQHCEDKCGPPHG